MPPPDVPRAPPGVSAHGSVSVAALDFGHLLVKRVREILVVHRLAVAAVAGLVLIGIVIGVVLAQLAGRAPAPTTDTKAPVIAPRAATGIVILEIAPWGEVLVDNKPVGVAPPLSQLTLPVGTHHIEIRHGDKPAVAAEVTVDPAQPQRMRHTFD
ncbi:MAG TPA: hypothetical protein VFR86_16965, partial [Burkholderiaceae bacterium]|nr:hypothetical protein [Burkholderiaceae bacterium]